MELNETAKKAIYKDIKREQHLIADLETACTLINSTLNEINRKKYFNEEFKQNS